MIILVSLLVFVAFVALLLLQWRKAELLRRCDQVRARTIERLEERFGDSPDFLEFAQSREGRLLLGARDPVAETGKRLLLLAQAAVVLAALGAGFIATVLTTPANADINLIRAAEEAKYWGTFCLALAGGLTVAFLLAQNRARAWGLLPR
jgi:hypothetical protein